MSIHFSFISYQTSDGVKRYEFGEPRYIVDHEAIIVQGSYSYMGPDGILYEVQYVADENGFRPTGAHLPKLSFDDPSKTGKNRVKGIKMNRIPTPALISLVG